MRRSTPSNRLREAVLRLHRAQETRGDLPQTHGFRVQVIKDVLFGEIDTEPGEFQLLPALLQEFLALGLGHGFGEAADHHHHRVDDLAGELLDHHLAGLAHLHHLLGQIRGGLDYSQDVPHRVIGACPKMKSGAARKKKCRILSLIWAMTCISSRSLCAVGGTSAPKQPSTALLEAVCGAYRGRCRRYG